MSLAKPSRTVSYDVSCLVEDQVYTLYTCPANCRSRMSLLFVSNANGVTSVDINWYRGSGARHIHIIGGKNLAAGEFIQFSDAEIVFEPGDYMTIVATANATPHIDALCTVTETFNPVG